MKSYLQQKTEDPEGLKVEPIQPKATDADKAAMVKLVFGLGCLVVGIISILVNHTRNSIVEDDYDYEDENRPEDLLPSNISDSTRLFTFRGVVFNDCVHADESEDLDTPQTLCLQDFLGITSPENGGSLGFDYYPTDYRGMHWNRLHNRRGLVRF